MEKERKELLAALQKEEEWAAALVAAVARDHAKDDDFKLEELLPSIPEKDLGKAWEAIASRVPPLVELVTSAAEEEAQPDQEAVCAAFRTLQAVVTLALGTLQAIKKATGLPQGLLHTMVALHDALFMLAGVDGEALQAAIAKVCEQWWREERGGAEHLVAQTVPYLVARSLEEDAREVLVKRVYAMRGALLLLDYEEEATGPFRALLLQCFLKPVYLRSADGRRLLTYLFGLHPGLVADIHETVKAQLPHAGRRLVQAYGDVYFRAWRAATGPYLEAIEQNCVQDLMQCAVTCASPALYASLRLFLQAFHANKRLREVDAMLLRLYNPILWRSLQVANPVVRAQATGLLVDAFPLQDPTMGTVEAASLLQKQLDMLQSLLVDPDPHVRVAAVCGVCRVMSVFWEAIPLGVTKAYITRLVGSLAFDGASALVRLAVVDGLRELLEQPLAHPVLKQALPLAAPLLHDKTPRVRAAFVGLLQRVKALGVRDIRFYEVVPVEQLLARFAADAEKTSARASVNRMADLLLNSYFPQGQGVTGSKQVSRCLTLLSQSKPAALAFYSRLREHVGLSPVARLIAMLLKCVFAALADQEAAAAASKKGATARPERKRKGGKKGAEATESSSSNEEGAGEGAVPVEMSASDRETLSGILEVVAALWGSIQGELSEERNASVSEMLKETLAGEDMAGLYSRLGCASPCLLQLAALCPELFATALGPPMARDLKEGGLGPDADEGTQQRAGPIAALLCLWGRTHEVVDLISTGLIVLATGTAPTAAPVPAQGKRKRAVGGLDAELAAVGVLPPKRALAMLDHLLQGAEPAAAKARALVLAAEMEGEGKIRAALGAVREAAAARVKGEGERANTPSALMVAALEISLRLELHLWGTDALSAESGEEEDEEAAAAGGVPQSMAALLDFVGARLLPPALFMEGEGDSEGSSSCNSGNEGGEGDGDEVRSPAPRKARTGKGHKSSKATDTTNTIPAPSQQLALELSAAALTVFADWVVLAPAVAARVGQRAEAWAQRLLLPALSVDAADEDDEAVARERRYAALGLLPQVCRLVYQLALQEAKVIQQGGEEGGASLPAPLLEVVVRAADWRPDAQEWHRYQDSGVDAAKCLHAILTLYARLRSHRAHLAALVDRLTALCLQELGASNTQQGEGECGEGVPPSPLLVAVCAVMAKSTPALNAAMTQTLAQLRATVTATATAALTPPTPSTPEAEPLDHAAAQASIELKARLLAALFGAAAEKAQGMLLPKLSRALGAAAADAEEAERAVEAREGEGEGVSGKEEAAVALGKAKGVLQGLEAQLRRLAVGEGEGMAVESC